jgi:hypothetical protein
VWVGEIEGVLLGQVRCVEREKESGGRGVRRKGKRGDFTSSGRVAILNIGGWMERAE